MDRLMPRDTAGLGPNGTAELPPEVVQEAPGAKSGALGTAASYLRVPTWQQWTVAGALTLFAGIGAVGLFAGQSDAAFNSREPAQTTGAAPAVTGDFQAEPASFVPGPMPMAAQTPPLRLVAMPQPAAPTAPDPFAEMRELVVRASQPEPEPPPATPSPPLAQDAKVLAMVTELGVISKQSLENIIQFRNNTSAWQKQFVGRMNELSGQIAALEKRVTFLEAERVVQSASGVSAPQRAVPTAQPVASTGGAARYFLASVSPSMAYVRVRNPMPNEVAHFTVPNDALPDLGRCQTPRRRGGVWEVPCEQGTIEGGR